MYLQIEIKNILIIFYCIIYMLCCGVKQHATGAEQILTTKNESYDILLKYVLSISHDDLHLPLQDADRLKNTVELLSCMRSKEIIIPMSKFLNYNTTVWTSRGFKDDIFAAALARISDYDCVVEPLNIEDNLTYVSPESKLCKLYRSLMPFDSIIVLIEDYIDTRENTMSEKEKKSIRVLHRNLLFLKKSFAERSITYSPLPFKPISNYTLNHPLYKARQATIKSNIELAQRILKETKNFTSINSETKTKLLAAVDELAKVRSVEAIEVITPILLLQSDKEIENLDKKYFSLRKYPVGVALVKIGIPSIWGLLDEIAKHSGNNSDEYRKIASDVMSSILIKKVIPGFVNEQLVKYKDNELAQIRLAKLLPLLDEDQTKIALLKPQFRIWKSSDGLFETRAKFISIDKKNDITLEKENGKQT
ncbi:MAG: hypothetical protein LBB88_07945, partial [Planctomycetaceae bacterium]|nr:hypothetical protein [Planctomycetaceae bacterium]